MSNTQCKQMAASAALEYLVEGEVVGVGTGSTADCFIEALITHKEFIKGAVASSQSTAAKLEKAGIPLFDLNQIDYLPVYVDGTDEFNPLLQLLKGRGGALTREKILATMAHNFICITDESKRVACLGKNPVVVETLPMARSFVARQLVKLGGQPVYRQGVITDNGNVLLDVYDLTIERPIELEQTIKMIPGVVENGIFALRPANCVLIGTSQGVEKITPK